MGELFKLRKRQAAGLESFRTSIRAGKRHPVMQAPTAFGKTVLAAHMATGCLERRKRFCFTVPLTTLVDQAFAEFVDNGIDPGNMGIIQSDHPWVRPHAPIQIASSMTIAARGFPEVDMVAVDECHVRLSVIDRWKAARPDMIFAGFSATPWAKGMAEQWDDLLIPATLKDLIEEGDAVPIKAYAPLKQDLDGIPDVGGDYHRGMLSERLRKPHVIGDMVGTWLDMADDAPTLVYAVDRAHAAELTDQFLKEGVNAAYVDGDTPREERNLFRQKSSDGLLPVVVSVATMIAGVDWPWIRCIMLGASTKSEIKLVQMVGRGVRKDEANGKTHLLLLDNSNSTLNLGLPIDIHHTELRSGKWSAQASKEREAPKPRECGSCKVLIPIGIKACIECGWIKPLVCNVTTIPGKLISFDEAWALNLKKAKKDQTWEWQTKASFYLQLCAYAIERNFKLGWAARQYMEKFGAWPDEMMKREPLQICTPAVRSWVKSQMIRRAKSKALPIAVAAE